MEKIKTGKLQKTGIVVGILTGITVFLSLLIGGVWVVFDWVDNKNDFQSTQTDVNLIVKNNKEWLEDNAKLFKKLEKDSAETRALTKAIKDRTAFLYKLHGIKPPLNAAKEVRRQKKEQSVKTEAEKEDFYSNSQ